MNRACDNQFQECQLAANTDDAAGFAVGDCDAQNSELSRFASNSLPRLSPPLHTLAPQKQKKKGGEQWINTDPSPSVLRGRSTMRAILCLWAGAALILTWCLVCRLDECKDVGRTSTPTSFPVLTSSNAEFDFFCDE